jgi:WD40 repeat protein
VAYSPAGDLVALGNLNGNIYFFDVADGSVFQILENPEDFGYAFDIAVSPDGDHLAVAGTRAERDEVLRVWVVDDGTEFGTVELDSQTRSVAYSDDASRLAVSNGDGVTIVDPIDMSAVLEIELDAAQDVSAWVTDLAYSPDGRFLFFSRWDGYVELWQVEE